MEIKKYLNKFWDIVWRDDSFKGWIISLIFIFIFIKFIFFPGLSFITGTSLPLAIVESCSMYHDGNIFSNYEKWWDRHDSKYSLFSFDRYDFEKFDFLRGMNKGDILFIVGAEADRLKEGDVVIFLANRKNPIIHRIVKIKEKDGERIFSTIGDNNNGQLSFEKEIKADQIVGKAVFKIAPYIGWMKLIFYEASRSSSERGFCEES